MERSSPRPNHSSSRDFVPIIDLAGDSSEEEDVDITEVLGSPMEDVDITEVRGSPMEDSESESVVGDYRGPLNLSPWRLPSRFDFGEDYNVSVTLSEKDVLDCPICCEPLKIPIFQCKNGHHFCPTCKQKSKGKCPTCSSILENIRCRAMENVLASARVSCRNSMYGCKETTLYGAMDGHAEVCVFTPCSCPMPGCNYNGNYIVLNDHFRSRHGNAQLVFVLGEKISATIPLDSPFFLQDKDDGNVFVIQFSRVPEGLAVSLSRVAPPSPDVGKFLCTLRCRESETSLKQELKVKNILNVRSPRQLDGFLLIPSYMSAGRACMCFGLQILRAG